MSASEAHSGTFNDFAFVDVSVAIALVQFKRKRIASKPRQSLLVCSA